MKQYPYLQGPWGKLVFTGFLFAMLLLARDTLVTSCLLGFTRSQMLMLGLIALVGLGFLAKHWRSWRQLLRDPRLWLMALAAAALLLPMLIKRDWQLMYFSILICLLLGFFLSFFTDLTTVSRCYVGILAVLGGYSLIASYLLRNLAWQGVLTPPVFYNDTGWEFYNFFLGYIPSMLGWNRNFGIFREPGVYQYFLLLGLYLNGYCCRWKRESTLWAIYALLAVVMLSTFSVGGVAELVLFTVFFYFERGYHRRRAGKIAAGVLLLAGALGAVVIVRKIQGGAFGLSPLYDVYDMFLRLTTPSESRTDRFSAIFTDIRFFLDNPLTGAKLAPVLHGTNHNTSSTLILFAVLGAAGGCLHLVSWIGLAWRPSRNFLANLILLGILFMSFNTQNLTADVFFWLFPCMALAERVLPWIAEKGASRNGSKNPETGTADPAGNCPGDPTDL